MKNPTWTSDESVLALDVYLRIRNSQMSVTAPAILELSHILQTLPIHPISQRGDTFRNPAGVHMILRNYQAIDPEYSGEGLNRGSKLQAKLWERYANDEPALHAAVTLIKKKYEKNF